MDDTLSLALFLQGSVALDLTHPESTLEFHLSCRGLMTLSTNLTEVRLICYCESAIYGTGQGISAVLKNSGIRLYLEQECDDYLTSLEPPMSAENRLRAAGFR